jgi:hypothetical protein
MNCTTVSKSALAEVRAPPSIATKAGSPLGQCGTLDEPTIADIARWRRPTQVIIH